MQSFEAVHQALRTLRTQRLRTFLTMFGVVWGTASVVFLLSWGLGVQRMLEHGFSKVGKNVFQVWAGNIGEDFTAATDRRHLWLTLEDVDVLRKRMRLAERVAAETRNFRIAAFRQKALSVDVRGVEPQHLDLRGVPLAAGRGLTRSDLDQRRRVALLGDKARRRLLGPQAGVGAWIRIEGRPFQVVGLLSPVGTQLWRDEATEIDEQIWVPITTVLASGPRYGKDENIIDMIVLRVPDRHLYDQAKREARAILAERLHVSPTDQEAFRMLSPIDLLRQLPVDEVGGLLLTLGVTTLLIGGIGILNLMLDSVQERRQEIGVRLAVGARQRDILAQFFFETLVMTGLGGLLGLSLGIGGCWLLAAFQVPDLIPVPILRLEIVGIAVGVMGFVALASGLIPAWAAARIEPSRTLRAE